MFSDSLLILTILNQNYKLKVTNQFVGRMKCINSIRIIYSVKIKQSVPFVLCRWFQCKMTVSDLAEHDWSSTTVYMYIHN